ncbi:MAG: hypothetical protein ACRDP3_13085 [Streptomyces sp.]|uniref:hypothetical protein n=1 Tax=Streptomyces sp. TaxID=1931 RepID=UPI003D6AAE51
MSFYRRQTSSGLRTGSAETADASTDLILARDDGRLHVLSRDPRDQEALVPSRAEGKEGVHDRLVDLLT